MKMNFIKTVHNEANESNKHNIEESSQNFDVWVYSYNV